MKCLRPLKLQNGTVGRWAAFNIVTAGRDYPFIGAQVYGRVTWGSTWLIALDRWMWRGPTQQATP